jgi:hypothetical protein
MPEVFDVQHLVSEFLGFVSERAYDHAEKKVAYACVVNNYSQLTPTSRMSDGCHICSQVKKPLYLILFFPRISCTMHNVGLEAACIKGGKY